MRKKETKSRGKVARDKILESNIQIWSYKQPKEAFYLSYVDPVDLSCTITKKKEHNLKHIRGKKKWSLHSPSGAMEEARRWFSSLNLNGVHVLYVYGVGLGYYYEAAKEWLKNDPARYLVFLENDIQVIRRLFETVQGTSLLRNPQVYLLYFQQLRDNEAIFEDLYWNFAMTPMVVTALRSYSRHKKNTFEKLQHKIAYDNAVKNALVEEYLKYGGNFFINYYQNILLLDDSYLGNEMFGKFTGVPAIICGAGPSLEINCKQLGNLTDKAIIFAGGSALNALNAQNIHPHFGAGIDPNSPQYDRLSSNIAFETPFFYRNRMFHNAFKMIHGPRLYITGSGGYDISEWIEKELGIESEFLDEGHNVVNFCTEIAVRMGCNPIIYVGMDLAFTEMKAYAPGIGDRIHVTKSELLGTDDFDSKAILQKDLQGKPIYTLWKWVAESEWIADYSKEHPENKFLNCTEGGLGFPGVENLPLAVVADKYLNESYDLRNRIHAEIQNCTMPQVTQEKVRNTIKLFQESLNRCRELFQELINEGRLIEEKIKKEKISPLTLQTGRAALYESDLAEEPAYQYLLEVFNVVKSRLLARKMDNLKHHRTKRSEWKKALERININEERFMFLRDVAKVNSAMIHMAIEGGPLS